MLSSSVRVFLRSRASPPLLSFRSLSSKAEDELIAINRSLLTAIGGGDFATYKSLVDENATCIEPETSKQIISGLAFHKFYFDLPSDPSVKSEPKNTSMADVHCKVVGKLGYLTYNRVTQVGVKTNVAQETRCWEKNENGAWKMTHFHKSV